MRSARTSVRDGVAVPGDLGGRPPRHVHITQNHSVYVNVSSYHWPTGGACWEVTVAAGEGGSPPPLEAPRWAHRTADSSGVPLGWRGFNAGQFGAGLDTRHGSGGSVSPGQDGRAGEGAKKF